MTIRIDTEVLNWFRDQVDKAGGGSYQAMINEALRGHIRHHREPLELTLRRVIRQELQALPQGTIAAKSA
ncbi:MAG: BrnA antitoxin family protein [bacterium]|nr:BrnA antitoxin family protein [bacterium]